MDTRVRRVNDLGELHDIVDDYVIQGYSVKEQTEKHAKVKKSNFGSGGMHVLWFLLTFWWTFGMGNVFYVLYAYFAKSQEIVIKVKK